jgi:hypothetical protein
MNPSGTQKKEEMMKRLVLIGMLLLLCVTLSYSQSAFDKGCLLISGTLGFQSAGGDLYKDINGKRYSMIDLEPALDYFVASNIFVGVGLDYEHESQGDWSKTKLGIGPNVGIGLQPPGSKTWPFIAAAYRFNSTKSKTASEMEDESTESKSSGSDIVIGGGVIYSIRPNLGIELDVMYVMAKEKPEGAEKSISGNVIAVGVGLTGMLF